MIIVVPKLICSVLCSDRINSVVHKFLMSGHPCAYETGLSNKQLRSLSHGLEHYINAAPKGIEPYPSGFLAVNLV